VGVLWGLWVFCCGFGGVVVCAWVYCVFILFVVILLFCLCLSVFLWFFWGDFRVVFGVVWLYSFVVVIIVFLLVFYYFFGGDFGC